MTTLTSLALMTVVDCAKVQSPPPEIDPSDYRLHVCEESPYVFLIGTSPEIMQLHTNSRIDLQLEESPFPNTRIAPASLIREILDVCPSIRYLPWTEELQNLFVEQYDEALQIKIRKIDEALTSDLQSQNAQDEVIDLQAKLNTALASNRILDETIHALRAATNKRVSNYATMTEDHLNEELRGANESVKAIKNALATLLDAKK